MEQKHYVGLTDEEVLRSRAAYGENVLTPPERESVWKKFLAKFQETIIIILLVALFASLCVAFYEYFGEGKGAVVFLEPVGILIAVILATLVGFLFELSAEKKFEILNQVNDELLFKVIRNNLITEVPRKEIVKGDIVLLNTGDEVPADGKLLESVSLQVNESTLTGEPVVRKSADEAASDPDATYPGWEVMKGTSVVEGHGIMEVETVGDATEYGKVYQGSQIENKIKTPLNIQLDKLASLITVVSYSIATLMVLVRVGLFFIHGAQGDPTAVIQYFLHTIMIAVTVIVVSVPEGLPMSVTLSLALSMKRMLSTNNLVRKLHACETMGATTVICTDKTGTLTQNQMRIYKTDFPALEGQRPGPDEGGLLVQEGISVNSTAYLDKSDPVKHKVLGNPTEGALLLWLDGLGINYLDMREKGTVIAQLPFSTERKYMATLIYSPLLEKRVLYVKGAPEIVLGLCTTVFTDMGKEPLSNRLASIQEELAAFQNQAMRTLGFAFKYIDEEDAVVFDHGHLVPRDLTFLGVTAISDPVRSDVPEAVKESMLAGIRIKIVTGDTPATATEIARQIGLWLPSDTDRNRITGPEFAALTDEEALNRVMDLKIMSRARPMDKERLVRLLQKKRQVVAVTGDGTNDAPALNAAQVGLSMGDGTTVAKEASDITILDNSFTSIGRAVMWGRSLYRNIQKFLFFQLIINVVACVIVFAGAFFETGSPLTVTQMLWVNLIMDTFAALALASLPPNPDVMKDKPRKSTDHILTRTMRRSILGIAAAFIVLLMGFVRYFQHYDITSLTQFRIGDWLRSFWDYSGNEEVTPYELTLFFTLFVFLQFWNLFNAKAMGNNRSAFYDLRDCLKGFVLVLGIILVGQILIVSFGGPMFSVTPLKSMDWLLLIGGTSLVLWIGELIRFIRRRF